MCFWSTQKSRERYKELHVVFVYLLYRRRNNNIKKTELGTSISFCLTTFVLLFFKLISFIFISFFVFVTLFRFFFIISSITRSFVTPANSNADHPTGLHDLRLRRVWVTTAFLTILTLCCVVRNYFIYSVTCKIWPSQNFTRHRSQNIAQSNLGWTWCKTCE